DEMNSWNHFADEAGVVGQKQIDAGLRGASEMDRIGRADPECSPDSRIMLGNFDGERYRFRDHAQQLAASPVGPLPSAPPISACEHLSESEGTRDQFVVPLLHSRM